MTGHNPEIAVFAAVVVTILTILAVAIAVAAWVDHRGRDRNDDDVDYFTRLTNMRDRVTLASPDVRERVMYAARRRQQRLADAERRTTP